MLKTTMMRTRLITRLKMARVAIGVPTYCCGSVIGMVDGTSRSRWFAAVTTKQRLISKQKRALNQEQLEGTTKEGSPSSPPPSAAALASSPSGGDGGGGGGNLLPALAGLTVLAGGGAYYYFNMMEQQQQQGSQPNKPTAQPAPRKPLENTGTGASKKEIYPAKKEAATAMTTKGSSGGNRVTTIQIPSKMKNAAPPAVAVAPLPAHPQRGNRVSMNNNVTKPKPPPVDTTSVTERAIAELRKTSSQETAQELVQSHRSLWKELDATVFADLDSLNNAQLKARVVQLATEMQDRTKWEAVRLKEFLAAKEKDFSDHYLQILQKQRLEFEGLLATRLREQEDALVKATQSALQEKDATIQGVINKALEAQRHEHEAEKKIFEERTTVSTRTNMEHWYNEQLTEYKKSVAQELEQKVKTLEELSKQLKLLESALAASQTSKKGSLQAHRLSAAALALSEKLETSQSAGKEFKALKAAAGDDSVIATALKSIPEHVVHSGVPTLPQLQTRFDKIYRKCRQAAFVPAGRPGLEGQLAGIVFSSLTYPPNVDDPAPEDDKGNAEFLLVRSRKHVQLGELDRAVEQIDKLTGQPAFTAQDWKEDAINRVAVEKALKVIKMECALLNESMTMG